MVAIIYLFHNIYIKHRIYIGTLHGLPILVLHKYNGILFNIVSYV